jgi:hypothetical protein
VVYIDGPETAKKLLDRKHPIWWQTKLEDAYEKYKEGVTDKLELLNGFGEPARVLLAENGELGEGE